MTIAQRLRNEVLGLSATDDLDQLLGEAANEFDRLTTALAACAAPFDTGPTTLSMAPHIICTEFQRRMNIAAMALTAGNETS